MGNDKKLKIGVLASGGGTNLQSIIDRCADDSLDAEIALVLCNNPGAGALERAARAGIRHLCVNHRDFSGRNDFDRAVVAHLQEAQVDLVVLAGFMRIISPIFLEAFPQRIVNIHPALLPAFPGLHVQQQAIDYGARFSGCTVHFVDAGVDTGPIIMQAVVPVLPDDSAEQLAARILVEEHKIYPRAIQLFAEGRIRIDGRKVSILPAPPPCQGALQSGAQRLMNRPEAILVSACLLGICCRYDGTHNHAQQVFDRLRQEDLLPVPVCPEQLGGLPTPRPKAWFSGGDGRDLLQAKARLLDEKGTDLAAAFVRGAHETLKIAQLYNCRRAILKERSPSCGSHRVHCDGELIEGVGVTCALLQDAGIAVCGEENLDAF